MTTSQKFFTNIISLNGLAFESVDKIVGDLNKNIGLSANLFSDASQVIGSTTVENYDLASIFGQYSGQITSDNSDALDQSLQNVFIGIGTSSSVPNFDVSTHISTNLQSYSSGIISSFLSGQIFYFNKAGIGNTHNIEIPQNLLQIYGNQYNSHLFDVPIDIGVFGIDNFNGSNYNNSQLVKFEYAWSYASSPSLIIHLNFTTSPNSNFYFVVYWGNNSSSFISTYQASNGISTYVGTQNFINNIGIYTSNINQISILNFSGRKNFWSNTIPIGPNFVIDSFVDNDAYLWGKDRVNASIQDGIESFTEPPDRYFVNYNDSFSGILTSNSEYAYVYYDFETSGLKYNPATSARLTLDQLGFSSNYYNLNTYNLANLNEDRIPGTSIVLQRNPKKINLTLSNGYSVISNQQFIPSAFVKTIEDYNIWSFFSKNLIIAKSYYKHLNDIVGQTAGIVDNFIAYFLFGSNNNNVDSYYLGSNLVVSKNSLKNFMQPYGSNRIDSINLSKFSEKSIFQSTKIIPSREFITFNEGKVTALNSYSLPSNAPFEIFKPISFVCNGIDPYQQGQGLAFDYTLNMSFKYQNQNTLNKTLYLMASKFLISKSDYENRIKLNQDVFGYYYLSDINSKDTSSYSVSSIDAFRKYGYSELIPDLKDGVVRPILTKAFSPVDNQKYTYEQYIQLLNSQGIVNPDDVNDAVQAYLDSGNEFYVINLDRFDNKFVKLENIAITMTNYSLNTNKYWNDVLPKNGITYQARELGDNQGITSLVSQIVSGGIFTSLSGITSNFIVSNIPVGYNCEIKSIDVVTVGANQIPGKYSSWLLPDIASRTDEQPGLIQYEILSNGTLNANSIKIINTGNYYFDFNVLLTDVGFSTGIGTSNAIITVNMNNTARFSATVSGYSLTAFELTKPPEIGYNAGFYLNNNCLYGLGFTATSNVKILINNYPTVDSFLISKSGLAAGDLEFFGNFQTDSGSMNGLNYTIGIQSYSIFESEVFNTISVSDMYNLQTVGFISLECKLIELNNKVPSGNIEVILYSEEDGTKNVVASSKKISYSEFNSNIYSQINIPIDYTFVDNVNLSTDVIYWLSVKNNLNNCFLNLKGAFIGISSSDFYIGTTAIYNSPSNMIVYGNISTSGYDLDLGISTISINGILNTNLLTVSTNLANIYLRKSSDYTTSENQIILSISTSNGLISSTIYSLPISANSLSTTFTGIAFTFLSSLQTGTIIQQSNLLFSQPIIKNQIFMARDFSHYSSIGLATSSQISIGGTTVGFNFIFNKMFSESDGEIVGSFNNTSYNMSGVANPNRLREIYPVNVVDGYWGFNSKLINKPLSIYPRAFISNNSTIGTSQWDYSYVGYTHDIFVNIGYNSNSVYKEELITLNAYPKWKTIWMSRDLSTYKNFNIFNLISSTYTDSIDYVIGSANTNIGFTTGPKISIFEGTFRPQGNLAQQVPIIVGMGTSSGVQVYINNSTQPIIDTFSVLSAGSTSVTGLLSTSVRSAEVLFKLYYYTLGNVDLQFMWNVIGVSSLINHTSSATVGVAPTHINSGNPIDNIVFLNVSKTISDANSVNNGFPTGDSFVIRST